MSKRNTARDAAMYQMMLRTGMVWEMEDDQEVRVQIHQNAGASGGLLKRSIPAADAIPRATVAAALAELRVEMIKLSKTVEGNLEDDPSCDEEHDYNAGCRGIIKGISECATKLNATITKFGLGEAK